MLGQTKSFEITTSKSKDEILNEIKHKATLYSTKDYLSKVNSIDYTAFELGLDTITISRWPFVWDLSRGIGIIRFKLHETLRGTDVKCDIEVMPRYVVISLFTLMTLVALFFALLSLVFDLSIILYLLLIYVPMLVIGYLVSRYHRRSLEDYSKAILKDLGIV